MVAGGRREEGAKGVRVDGLDQVVVDPGLA
jgi:hypothetical protein